MGFLGNSNTVSIFNEKIKNLSLNIPKIANTLNACEIYNSQPTGNVNVTISNNLTQIYDINNSNCQQTIVEVEVNSFAIGTQLLNPEAETFIPKLVGDKSVDVVSSVNNLCNYDCSQLTTITTCTEGNGHHNIDHYRMGR